MKTLLFTSILLVLTTSHTTVDIGYKVGDMAGDFKLKNVDGKMVSLADDKKAKGFIVIFTCNHCPFSQAYEQRIIDLHRKFASKGYPVIAINPNDAQREPEDSYEKMKERAKDKKYPFVYLHDETQQVAKMYGAARTPHVFLLQKIKGQNKVVYIGAIDDNSEEPTQVKERYVEMAIQAINTGKPVVKPTTKAIGCTIKWKKN